jgi:hypothetical protein
MTKHFAKLDENNKVINVHVVHDSDCQDESNNYSEAIGINFLTKLHKWNFWTGLHNKNGLGGIDDTYVADGEYFKPPQPYPSWTFNLSTYTWEAPKAHPEPENSESKYVWNELAAEWQPLN